MTRNSVARNTITIGIGKDFQHLPFFATLVIFLLFISILPASASEQSLLAADNEQPHCVNLGHNYDSDSHMDLERPQEANNGFIFPYGVKKPIGYSTDKDNNGVEDFIEANSRLYSGFKYIDTVVTLRSPATDEFLSKLEVLGCRVDHVFTLIDAVGVSIPVNKLKAVGKLPLVEMVQNVQKVKHHLSDGVPLVKASQARLSSAGYNGITGEGVTIAVIDSGIAGSHSTFSGRIIAFRDLVYGQNDLDPTDGMNSVDYGYHGTMCASCAAGNGGGTAYKGVAIKANLIAVVVDNTYQMIQGIEWCVNNRNKDFNRDGVKDGPDIITMSMGVQGTMSYLDNTAGNAMDNGVVFVTSAGNDGPEARTVTSPSTSPKVIGVGATYKTSKQIASFSSRGPGPGGINKPDIVAPGTNLVVAYPNNQWTGGASGTSFSGPIARFSALSRYL